MNDTQKSTATAAQHQRLLKLLADRPQNTFELRRAGVAQVSTRVFELRARGFKITTRRAVVTDDDGFRHAGVAVYSLVQAKAQVAA